MAKTQSMMTKAQWEGGDAAKNGRGRSTNPYPQSDIMSRNQWFAGYDETIDRISRDARKPRLRDF